ncbi:MAG: DEAD/DEAH box helicase family protein [Candidatus Peregrinibacteria bacterium]
MESESHSVGAEGLVQRIESAEEVLDASLASIERRRGRGVAEKIDRLRLFRKFLVNIRLNTGAFEQAPIPLRINQLQALHDLIAFLEDEGNGDRVGYFVQPSGAGKTVLYGAVARLMDVRTLTLVPRSNLLEQVKRDWVETLGMQEDSIGLVGGEHDELGRKFTIANYQSHLSRMRRDPKYRREAQECELVLCDEAHKSLGDATAGSIDALDLEFDRSMSRRDEQTEETTFAHLSKYTSRRALKLGFTATPRLIQKSVRDRFKTLISQTSYSGLVQSGILAKFKVMQIPAHIYPEEVGNGITLSQETHILSREEIYRKAVEALQRMRQEIHERLLPIAFCSSIRECDKLQAVADEQGLSSSIVTGREYRRKPREDHIGRAEMQLLNGEIDLIASVDKLQVGWDFPPLNTILQMRATLSAAILTQEAGRVSRIAPGKSIAYVIEPRWRRNRPSEQEISHGRIIIRRKDAAAPEGRGLPQDIAGISGQADSTEENATPFYWETTLDKRKKRRQWKGSAVEPSEDQPQVMNTKLKFHKTPLTLAEAFHVLGEKDVDAICEGWHGEPLRHGTVLSLDEQGMVKINGHVAVGLNAFASIHGLGVTAIQKEADERKLTPIGIALSYVHYVPVYKLCEIQALSYVRDRLELERLTEGGEVLIGGCICVGASAYAKLHGLNDQLLNKHITAAGLKPVGDAISRNWKIPVYRKSDIETLPYVQKCSHLQQVDTSTHQITIDSKVCIGLRSFAQLYGLSCVTLERSVQEEGLQPSGRALHYTRTIDVFPIQQLEELQYVRDRRYLPKIDQATAEVILQGHACIGLKAFCSLHPGLYHSQLVQEIEIAGIEHAGFAISKSGAKVKVYNKATVLALPYVQEKLDNK